MSRVFYVHIPIFYLVRDDIFRYTSWSLPPCQVPTCSCQLSMVSHDGEFKPHWRLPNELEIKKTRKVSGWWFGTFFIFPYIGNNHPNWLSYFSEGFKPPTRYISRIIFLWCWSIPEKSDRFLFQVCSKLWFFPEDWTSYDIIIDVVNPSHHWLQVGARKIAQLVNTTPMIMVYIGGFINGGTPKWLVYNGKSF